MVASTVISAYRPPHRTVRVGENAFQGAVALDWANGQGISLSGVSQQSSVFDATNDRIVMVSVGGGSGVIGAWISVGTSPTASAGAGSMWVSQQESAAAVYVPQGMVIAGLQGATGGVLSMIPALVEA